MKLTASMEDQKTLSVRVTCLDFTKAFDRLQHHRLINHLDGMKFNHSFLRWLCSFLKNRFQRVSINESLGPLIPVYSGVPQGSVLGPYLFALFISTLKINAPNTRLVKYADDLTLIESCTTLYPDQPVLQSIERWACENNMTLNNRKCQQMVINRSKNPARFQSSDYEMKPSVNILGATLNDRLSWTNHFDRVVLAATRRLHIIRSLKPYISEKKLLEVFSGSVLSVILYASPVFAELPVAIQSKIANVCERAHRIICNRQCSCSIIPDIAVLREKLACNLLLKCEIHDHPLHSYVPSRLPKTGKFRQPFSSTSRRFNSFFPYTCALVNSKSS